jgi:phage FluMu protein Com
MPKIGQDESCPCGSGKTFGACHSVIASARRNWTPSQSYILQLVDEPPPNTRSVFESTSVKGPLFEGDPSTDYSLNCGSCGETLVKGVPVQSISGLILKCPQCSRFNETNTDSSPRRDGSSTASENASVKIEDRTFTDLIVRLDFHDFSNCVFSRCTFVYGGFGPVSLSSCRFDECKWTFADAAGNTLAFLALLYRSGVIDLVEATFQSIRGNRE